MFLATKPGALHVNPRNGVFYKPAFTEQGLRGELYDVDLDPIITSLGDAIRGLWATASSNAPSRPRAGCRC